jgi:pyridinium-3,5-biscarboxylic acid mononucleotide sulfurtransferase
MDSKDGKTLKLDSILKDLNSFVVAFSGGVDSTFLLHHAHKVKKSGVIGITIRTPCIPSREIEEAIEFTSSFGIKYEIIDLAFPEIIKNNPIDRCYSCKKTIFTNLLGFAKENNYQFVIDGTNADDLSDFRLGIQALKELGIRSPLLESGLTKNDIRELSKEADLDIWDKPAIACLLTRIPYDTEVNEGVLRLVEEAENMLLEQGFPGTRVRIHGDLARIECLPGYIEKIVRKPQKEQIISNLKKIGFRYVSLDLEGYRAGTSNPEKREI